MRELFFVDVLHCRAVIADWRLRRCNKPTHPGAVTCVEHLYRHEELLPGTIEAIRREPLAFSTPMGSRTPRVLP